MLLALRLTRHGGITLNHYMLLAPPVSLVYWVSADGPGALKIFLIV